jgi:hypothetical protein
MSDVTLGQDVTYIAIVCGLSQLAVIFITFVYVNKKTVVLLVVLSKFSA